MKLTKQQLKQLIQEELQNALQEAPPRRRRKSKRVYGAKEAWPHILKACEEKWCAMGYDTQQLEFRGYNRRGKPIVRPIRGEKPFKKKIDPASKAHTLKRNRERALNTLKRNRERALKAGPTPLGVDGKPLLTMEQIKVLKKKNKRKMSVEWARIRGADKTNKDKWTAREKEKNQGKPK